MWVIFAFIEALVSSLLVFLSMHLTGDMVLTDGSNLGLYQMGIRVI